MKHTVNRILDKLVTLLGFSSVLLAAQSCVEYGSPHAGYKLNVKVSDTSDNPLKGIRVIYLPDGEQSWEKDTLYTDTGGIAAKDLGDRIYFNLNAELLIDDVDGDAGGGKFKSKTARGEEIRLVQTKKGDRKWYGGEFDIISEVKLEKED